MAKVLLPSESMVYVNPDDIAAKLTPDNVEASKISAGKAALEMVAELLKRGESFAVESTLSGMAYAKLLKKAKTLGYEITTAYVYVDSPTVCIKRIAVRVKAGGHYIPDNDVERRYFRGKRNFVEVYRHLSDHWLLCYNGGTDLQLVAHGNGQTSVLDDVRYEKFMERTCRT